MQVRYCPRNGNNTVISITYLSPIPHAYLITIELQENSVMVNMMRRAS